MVEQEIYRYILPRGSVTRWFPDETVERVEGPAFEYLCIKSQKQVKIETDPTLISKKLEVIGRNISRPIVVQGSSRHRAQMVTVHNGRAHAEEGTVVFDTKVCPVCGSETLTWDADGAYCASCGRRF